VLPPRALQNPAVAVPAFDPVDLALMARQARSGGDSATLKWGVLVAVVVFFVVLMVLGIVLTQGARAHVGSAPARGHPSASVPLSPLSSWR
jgi:hypothetical protein